MRTAQEQRFALAWMGSCPAPALTIPQGQGSLVPQRSRCAEKAAGRDAGATVLTDLCQSHGFWGRGTAQPWAATKDLRTPCEQSCCPESFILGEARRSLPGHPPHSLSEKRERKSFCLFLLLFVWIFWGGGGGEGEVCGFDAVS